MQKPFRALADLCEGLEATSKRTKMVSLVADFLKSLSNNEVEPAASIILGHAFPKGDKRSLEISWATLSRLIKRLAKVEWNDFTKAFDKTGDMGAATKTIFEASKIQRQLPLFENPLTILEVRRSLKAIAETTGFGSREKKERLLETLLGKATPVEAKYIVKTIVGEMRTGFHDGLMELAVVKAFDLPHHLVQKASMLTGDIAEVAAIAKSQGQEGVSKLQLQVFKPIKPMLAQSAENVYEALREHEGETAFEHKLDGARVQIHKSKDVVRIYSRRLTEVTNSFPEIVDFVRRDIKANEAILEGEIVAVGKDGNPLPFQNLMKRFRRIHGVESMIARIPVELYLFDIVYLNGQSLIEKRYIERRKKLRQISRDLHQTKQVITNNPIEAEGFFREAIEKGHEGLVAKKPDSPYTPGIRGKRWFKIKESLEPLDLVIVAAEYGHGRRHDWLSDYYLAAREPKTGEFLVVGKTFKGLKDEEIIEITGKLKELTVKEEHRRVIVTPEIVVEVSYNEIQESPKYKCGMALRFARITKIRNDKSPEEADNIQRIREIYEKQFEKKARS